MRMSLEPINKNVSLVNSDRVAFENKVEDLQKENLKTSLKILEKWKKYHKKEREVVEESFNNSLSKLKLDLEDTLNLTSKKEDIFFLRNDAADSLNNFVISFDNLSNSFKLVEMAVEKIKNDINYKLKIFQDTIQGTINRVVSFMENQKTPPVIVFKKGELSSVKERFAIVLKGFLSKGFYFRPEGKDWIKII